MDNQAPIILDSGKEALASFKARLSPVRVLDAYKDMLQELFFIRNPHFRFTPPAEGMFDAFAASLGGTDEGAGNWVYFPWIGTLVHYLSESMHQELRTARNRNLITIEEQDRLYGLRVGIAGLSVGSHAALTLAMMGGAKAMRLADPDIVSGSNLNRVRYDLTAVGEKKSDLVSRWIWQANPYADLQIYPEGINSENAGEFVEGLDLLIEELDNLEMKVTLREEARRRGIPVIMITDNGDGVIADVERYDENPGQELFNGALGAITVDAVRKTMPSQFPTLATKVAGPKMVAPRMLESVLEVGKTLYSWPQLGDAATLAGATAAYLARKFALGTAPKSGKYSVSFDNIFDPDLVAREEAKRSTLLKTLGIDDF